MTQEITKKGLGATLGNTLYTRAMCELREQSFPLSLSHSFIQHLVPPVRHLPVRLQNSHYAPMLSVGGTSSPTLDSLHTSRDSMKVKCPIPIQHFESSHVSWTQNTFWTSWIDNLETEYNLLDEDKGTNWSISSWIDHLDQTDETSSEDASATDYEDVLAQEANIIKPFFTVLNVTIYAIESDDYATINEWMVRKILSGDEEFYDILGVVQAIC